MRKQLTFVLFVGIISETLHVWKTLARTPPNFSMAALLEVIDKTTAFFKKKGLENPRLNTELIFAHVLDCKRLDLYLSYDRPVDDSLLDKVRPLVKRRASREPLQYILGDADFFNIKLKVDSRALIPRPETEELVELVIQTFDHTPKAILDLGCGCGAITLALAVHFPQARVTASDNSDDALALACENAEINDLSDNVSFLNSKWFDGVSGAFDLIVSNPPYLSEEEWAGAQPEVREYEPRRALVAAEGGIAELRKIICEASAYLNTHGMLALETGPGHHQALATLARQIGYIRWESRRDLCGHNRFFLAFK